MVSTCLRDLCLCTLGGLGSDCLCCCNSLWYFLCRSRQNRSEGGGAGGRYMVAAIEYPHPHKSTCVQVVYLLLFQQQSVDLGHQPGPHPSWSVAWPSAPSWHPRQHAVGLSVMSPPAAQG